MDKERQEEIDSLQALYYEGDMAVVIPKAQELVRQYQSATAINILALAHKRQGNIDQARQIFEQVLLDNPTNVLFLGNLEFFVQIKKKTRKQKNKHRCVASHQTFQISIILAVMKFI